MYFQMVFTLFVALAVCGSRSTNDTQRFLGINIAPPIGNEQTVIALHPQWKHLHVNITVPPCPRKQTYIYDQILLTTGVILQAITLVIIICHYCHASHIKNAIHDEPHQLIVTSKSED